MSRALYFAGAEYPLKIQIHANPILGAKLFMTHTVVLLRHGESDSNASGRFIGWDDVALTAQGILEAREAGLTLLKEGLQDFDAVYCSYLKRSIKTAWIVAETLNRCYVPVLCRWQLNEQMYGALQGLSKRTIDDKYGSETVHTWRRSYDIPPPAAPGADSYFPKNDRKYVGLTDADAPETWSTPGTESLRDAQARVWNLWATEIGPAILAGQRILVVAHNNVLRALLQKLDTIEITALKQLSVPRAIPLVYELDSYLKPSPVLGHNKPLSGRFLGSPALVERRLALDIAAARLPEQIA